MTLLSVAMLVALASAVYVVIRWPNYQCWGDTPLPTVSLLAILFTSGLDVGLIMFPLIDFETYATGADYSFASPLVVEFGFWGGIVWGFYVLTTLYFCAIEPRLKFFERPLVRWVHNLVVVATCAFTAYLFLAYLPSYVEGINPALTYFTVGSVIVVAVLSSTRLSVLRVLSVGSTAMFLLLIVIAWLASGVGVKGLVNQLSGLSAYVTHLDYFISPLNDYHGFYLSWWFAWSIMIGQFVARFVNGMRAWKLALAILFVPSIPIALWFSVLFGYFESGLAVGQGGQRPHDWRGHFVCRQLAGLTDAPLLAEPGLDGRGAGISKIRGFTRRSPRGGSWFCINSRRLKLNGLEWSLLRFMRPFTRR